MTLESRYWGSFFACTLLCIALQILARSSFAGGQKSGNAALANPRFNPFQRTYLFVFILAMFSDWLQGPYVYELYVSYGFSQQQIAELFVCGFGSSMIVGTFVGALADQWGRKLMCVTYCVCYIAACFTKMVPNYWILMIGRFLSGISTSLLFSVFESWMVCEHHKNGFDGSLLGDTFSYATFGNGLGAVIAGLVANRAADAYGYVAPFVVAILPLTIVASVVSLKWTENYGNQAMSFQASLTKAVNLIRFDSRIAALGFAQSSFEGAMYTFVFMWTPALKSVSETQAELDGETGEDTTSQYLGLIFAVFMVCVMIGSSLFKLVSGKKENIYRTPLFIHAIACVAMTITSLFFNTKAVVYIMFLVFETLVGLFYPAYGVIKSERIPEEIRSSVMNIFRMPLNAFVVILLLKIKYLSPQKVFAACATVHGLAFISFLYFYSAKNINPKRSLDVTEEGLLSEEGSEDP
mmetsp:Transcript_6149/g.6343  ORF Transcript_6149/g.6343 Transcript_6149/m.6343 type:complete len:466 (-) Transcript_6149:386-1783(-)|eukprot:CAMPEP_0182424532 /NCGR_PEP_ID=MMETSP1167-20130531/10734_1 /TAXON_ID=2988 /ORGANISM="Mallomonas Sp, Strain CCMP3275" /LENGTH=465 /DNA_ID=CAMNT_0024604411 /DNA_START=364 /DNA_END=1761 /DNA_ORIENTATION=+